MPKTPINYQNTIIYKIVCNDLNIKDIYVGHTTDFRRRKNGHKTRCSNENDKSFNFKVYQTIRQNGGWDNWIMIEIEKYPCTDSNEATARERYWFEQLSAKLNSQTPNRTKQEYEQNNKEKTKEYIKQYYEENKSRLNEMNKQYREKNKDKLKEMTQRRLTCECGSVFRIGEKSNHLKTIKHKKFIEEQNI